MKLKKVLIFILIILIISAGFVGIAYFGVNEVVTIEVKEMSILQQKFVVQSPYDQGDENAGEANGTENSENSSKDDSGSKGGNSSSSSGGKSSGKKSSKKTYGYGTSDYEETVTTVTPKIKIPRTGINLTIYPEMSLSAMERGAVIFATDNGLNEVGNTVISAHNTVNSRFFSKNARLQIGDLIYVTDPSGRQLTYTVYNKYITGPNDASYIDRDTDGDTEISLSTCTDDGQQRIIIWAYAI